MTDVQRRVDLRLDINKYKLDEEWENQSIQREYFGRKLADALLVVDEAKSELSVVVAELDRSIREFPEEFGLSKVTETAVAQAVIVSKKHKEATSRLNNARHVANVMQAAVDGLEHRKRALSMLVELYGQEYFSVTSGGMPKGVRSERRRTYDDDEDTDA